MKRCMHERVTALLRGPVVGDGCVIGTNAVVRATFGPGQLIAELPGRVLMGRWF